MFQTTSTLETYKSVTGQELIRNEALSSKAQDVDNALTGQGRTSRPLNMKEGFSF